MVEMVVFLKMFQDTHGGNGSFLKDALDNTQDNYLGTREFLDLVMF